MGVRIIDQTTDLALSSGDYVIVDSSAEGTRKFDLGTELNQLKSDAGDLSELDTEDKSSLVNAINEVAQSGGGGGGSITIDSAMSSSSTNPVQNKVIYSALQGKADNGDIPTKTSDLVNDSGFITSAPVTSVNGQTGAVVIGNATTSAAGLMSATDKSHLDTVYADYSSALSALGVI